MVHELKCWPEHFAAVQCEQKRLELRSEVDRHFEVGDLLHLREWDSALSEMAEATNDPELPYTGRECRFAITHVLRDPEGRWLQPGVAALSIVKLDGTAQPEEVSRD